MIRKIAKDIIGEPAIRNLRRIFSMEAEITVKRRNFHLQFLKKGDLFFDVGANLGNRIFPIVHLGIRIIAIEPQQECIEHLKKHFGNKITIVPKGLGAEKGEETMFIADMSILSSFAKDWINETQESGRFSDHQWDEQRTIEMTTLDVLIEKYGHPDFIKIDVEGYELEVLKGLSQPVKMVSLEYTVPEQTDILIACMIRLNDICNQNSLFNYSIGESMEWATDKWLSLEEMTKVVNSKEFIDTTFGDIYMKNKM
ncbi:methyltransferase, FkbM family [Bernardetia litoralis DSM 6794]|uniref:Methyltransferase, FkbM family n=1 Tax=Bernardetia litoralis (strain ATCC 23117 / DSM 6794 / NBRC 15988 / NCIMB 1366 / Fx l1 / Sio-4) TaxID=880071 RepID=I4AH92_BERLS|nr:FkbM family methyltransferase [Bernardetia litoralis]AFM03327.1 methyltransferase, FkbM family [Bernardetia litoralis DSM 6794]